MTKSKKFKTLYKSLLDNKKFVVDNDYKNEQVKLYSEDGTTLEMDHDQWFQILEFSMKICKINDELCDHA